MLDPTQVPLLALPPELGNAVYELAFDGAVLEVYQPLTSPSLLLTCKQINDEALSIFYTSVTFQAQDEDSPLSF